MEDFERRFKGGPEDEAKEEISGEMGLRELTLKELLKKEYGRFYDAREFIESLKETPVGKYFEGQPMPTEAELRKEVPVAEGAVRFNLEEELYGEGGEELRRQTDQLLEELRGDPTSPSIIEAQMRADRQSLWGSNDLDSEGRAELLMDQIEPIKELLKEAKSSDPGQADSAWIIAATAIAAYRRFSDFKGESFWSTGDQQRMEGALRRTIAKDIRSVHYKPTATDYRRATRNADILHALSGRDGLQSRERKVAVRIFTNDTEQDLERYEFYERHERTAKPVDIFISVAAAAILKRTQERLTKD